jgi:hypothetical protein
MSIQVGDKVKVLNHIKKGVGIVKYVGECCINNDCLKMQIQFPDGKNVVVYDEQCVKIHDSFDEIFDGVISLDNWCKKHDISPMLVDSVVTFQLQFC